MMRDLFSDLPDRDRAEHGNYATRLAQLWIAGDPALVDRCKKCARRSARNRRPLDDLADELRVLVARQALQTERHGLFFDLFTDGLREVQWSEIANFYREAAAHAS